MIFSAATLRFWMARRCYCWKQLRCWLWNPSQSQFVGPSCCPRTWWKHSVFLCEDERKGSNMYIRHLNVSVRVALPTSPILHGSTSSSKESPANPRQVTKATIVSPQKHTPLPDGYPSPSATTTHATVVNRWSVAGIRFIATSTTTEPVPILN